MVTDGIWHVCWRSRPLLLGQVLKLEDLGTHGVELTRRNVGG